MNPANLSEAMDVIASLRMELRHACEDARTWRRFLAFEKWWANAEYRPRIGQMIVEWDKEYTRDIDRKCSGEE